MKVVRLTLAVLDHGYTVCRLAPEADVPYWLPASGLVSVTRTAEELSIVCPSDAVPASVEAERDFHALKIKGPLDFSLTGILLAVAAPLAEAAISIFALSTYDTDYVLVRKSDLDNAVRVLKTAGHTIDRTPPKTG
jgi:hypothetical protein